MVDKRRSVSCQYRYFFYYILQYEYLNCYSEGEKEACIRATLLIEWGIKMKSLVVIMFALCLWEALCPQLLYGNNKDVIKNDKTSFKDAIIEDIFIFPRLSAESDDHL